jgi:hypothetical protein
MKSESFLSPKINLTTISEKDTIDEELFTSSKSFISRELSLQKH